MKNQTAREFWVRFQEGRDVSGQHAHRKMLIISSRMANYNSLTMPRADKGVEPLERAYIVGGNQHGTSGSRLAVSYQVKWTLKL